MPLSEPKGFTVERGPFCELEPRSQHAWRMSGLHPDFVKPILDIATIHNTMLLIRANDNRYNSLLTERYTTKSMRLHAKTCSWGPMTGFVCLDPRFHKKPLDDQIAYEFQLRGHIESLSYEQVRYRLKRLSPLRITEARVEELFACNIISPSLSLDANTMIVNAVSPSLSPGTQGPAMKFRLIREMHGTKQLFRVQSCGGEGRSLSSILSECAKVSYTSSTDSSKKVFFEQGVSSLIEWIRASNKTEFISPQDVLTLVDPLCPYPETDYRCATTGDYDLFALHPLLSHFASQTGPDSYPLCDSESRSPNWIKKPASLRTFPPHAVPHARDLARTRIPRRVYDVPAMAQSTYDLTSLASSFRMDSPTISSPYKREGGVSTSVDGIDIIPRSRMPRVSSPRRTPSSDSAMSPSIQGALSNRELILVVELNHAIDYNNVDGKHLHGLRLFHHGPDSHRPSASKPDLPCVALIPCATHACATGATCFRAVYLDSPEKLGDFYIWSIICNGYALTPGVNLKWFDQGSDIRPIIVRNQADRPTLRSQDLIDQFHLLRKQLEMEAEFLNLSEDLRFTTSKLWI